MRHEFSEYDWLNKAFTGVAHSYDRGKLPHGLMLVAPELSGKQQFASALAQSILCKESKDRLQPACKVCKNCLLVESKSHPDLSMLDCLTDNKGKQKNSIGIDQVRHLTSKLVETSQMGGWRVAIIASVEKLTRGAFNALLKTLEEPGEKTLLLMLANSSHRVPATIKSRCQLLSLDLNSQMICEWLVQLTNCSHKDAEEALEQCFYSPFKSLEFINNQGAIKTNALHQDLERVLGVTMTPNEFVNKYAELNDELWAQIANYFHKVQLSILESKHTEYSAVPKTLPAELYDSLVEYNRAISVGSNLQTKLQLEVILIRWFELGRKIVHYSNR